MIQRALRQLCKVVASFLNISVSLWDSWNFQTIWNVQKIAPNTHIITTYTAQPTDASIPGLVCTLDCLLDSVALFHCRKRESERERERAQECTCITQTRGRATYTLIYSTQMVAALLLTLSLYRRHRTMAAQRAQDYSVHHSTPYSDYIQYNFTF